MFYYYGRKKQIARHYPSPNYDAIVEPFAGSAAYSLYGDNWKKQIILVEKDERVAALWDWLIDEATPESILSLADAKVGEKSSEFLHIIHAVTKMAFAYKTIKVTPVLARNWEISRRHMAANLHKIKYWKIICADYKDSPDIEATWFIDPPYKDSPGRGYQHSSSMIDYNELAIWGQARQGDVIFCEGEFGDYLPFSPLLDLPGVAGKRSKEAIYYRSDKKPDQLPLFID